MSDENVPRVTVLMPEDVTVRMVAASALGDYELAFFVAGLFASFSSGFAVAGVSATVGCVAWTVAALFFALAGLFGALTTGAVAQMRRKRQEMFEGQRHVPFGRAT